MKTIFLLCGPPASGKSSWAAKRAIPGHSAIISRDRIRFEKLKDGEDYFAHEDEVLEEFYEQINAAIKAPWVDEVYIDATHLTKKARNATMEKICIPMLDSHVIAVAFDVPADVCLIRNERRTGRAYVPPKAVQRMHKQFKIPTDKEVYPYNEIWRLVTL